MKKLLFLSFLFIIGTKSFCQIEESDSFSYQKIMNSDRWQKSLSTPERMEMLQIPDDIIKKASTKRLLDLCLEYPYNIDILFYSDYSKGLLKKMSKNHGYQELLKRKDLIAELINKDKEILDNQRSFLTMKSKEQGYMILKSLVLNLLLSKEEVRKEMTEAQKDVVTESFNRKADLAKQDKNLFSGFNKKVIKQYYDNVNPQKIPAPLRTLSSDYVPTTIYTPFKSIVPDAYVFTGTGEPYNGWQWEKEEDLIYELYHMTLVTGPSKSYNSHGYAWNESNTVWIEDSGVDTYWLDGSYIEVPASEATLVYYVDGHHSAKKISQNVYMSKLGDGILVEHGLTSLPEEYYPTGAKRYYKKAMLNCSLEGPSHLCNTGIYTISNVPSGCNVSWSFMGNSSLNSNILPNYPTQNQCRISNYDHGYINDTLSVTVTKNGFVLAKEKMKVYSNLPFYGTYSQTPEKHNKYHYPTIPETPFPENETTFSVNQDCDIIIKSEAFKGKTVTYSSQYPASILLLRVDEETIKLFVNHQNRVIPITMYANSDEGCDDFSFTVLASHTLLLRNLNVSSDGDIIKIMLPTNSEDTIGESKNSQLDWKITVTEISTGKIAFLGNSSDSDITIGTSLWESGLYNIRIENGSNVIDRKIVVK